MALLVIIISVLYASMGVVATAGYVPTIRDLIKKKATANVHSYMIWSFTYLVSFMYIVLVVPDILLEIVSGLGFLSCALIVVLSLRLKKHLKKS